MAPTNFPRPISLPCTLSFLSLPRSPSLSLSPSPLPSPKQARGSKSRVRLQGVTLGRSLEPRRRSPWPPHWRARVRRGIHPRRNSGVGCRYPGLACVYTVLRYAPAYLSESDAAVGGPPPPPPIFRLAIPSDRWDEEREREDVCARGLVFWVTGLHPRVNRVYVPIPSLPVSLSGVYQLFLFSFLYHPSFAFLLRDRGGCSFSRIIESTRLTIIRRVDQKCIQTREIQERSYGYSDSFLGMQE